VLQDISFISHCPPSLSTSAPPLTVDNVLTAVQRVDWRMLGKELLTISSFIGDSKLEEIRGQHQSDADRLHAVVTTWMQSHWCKPSWRQLIWTLDHIKMAICADKIRHFAEPVLGESCDSISIPAFLYSVCVLEMTLMQACPISTCA